MIEQAAKACSDCGAVKEPEFFSKNKNRPDGLCAWCKPCGTERTRVWRAKHPEKRLARDRKWRAEHPDAGRIYAAEWRRKNPGRTAAAEQARRLADKDKDRAERRRQTELDRLKPHKVLHRRMASRVRLALKGGKQGKSWLSMVDYSVADLMAHIERQFLRGMRWENMGEWHIDHIVPLASFKVSSPDDPEFKRAWALPNLRPLWAADNFAKNAKLETLL